jgi:hypothetical protein
MRKTKEEKALEARITRLYGQVASGVQIPMMEVPKVWKVAHAAVAAGESDEQVASAIAAYVAKVRVN